MTAHPGPPSEAVMDRVVAGVRAMRDVLLIALGLVGMVSAPESLQDFGLSTPGTKVWAACVLLGAAGALLAGMTRRLLLELWSCCVVSGGLLLWAVALVWRDEATASAWSVALLALSTIAGEVVRIADTVGERQATR